MGKNKFLRSKQQPISKRKSEIRNPKTSAILIVTEGEKTEPLYFQGIANYISTNFENNIDINSPKLTIQGKGLGTVRLVKEAAIMVSRSTREYSQCWVVFDKDYYTDFDEAVSLANRYGLNVAWSNSSFEYWLLLHFKSDSIARTPSEWCQRLDEELKKAGLLTEDYGKNNACISVLATSKGYLKRAVENAQARENQQISIAPSKQNPGTTVHHLIASLKPYIAELL